MLGAVYFIITDGFNRIVDKQNKRTIKKSMFNLDRQSNTKHKTKKSLNIKNVHQTINYHNNECLVIENVTHLARKRQLAVAPNKQ